MPGGPIAPVEPPVVSGQAFVGISAAEYTAAAVAQGASFRIISVAMQKNPFAIAPPPPASPGRLALRDLRSLGTAGMAGVVVLALCWGGMAVFDLNPFFAKRPADVWAFLVSAPEAEANRAVLASALAQTLSFAVPGYMAGLLLGAGLAMALILVSGLAAATLPAAIALRSVPILTTAPLIVLSLGRGATGTITFVAVMIFFPTLVAFLGGMRQTPGQVIDVFESYAASRLQRLVHAQLPAMLPAFFAPSRMVVPAALLAVTTAEWLATGKGIGALMALTTSTSAFGMLWSATAVLSLAAVLAYLVVGALERAVLRRHAAEQVTGEA